MAGLFRLTLLPYLQSWDPATGILRLNVIAYPVGDPRESLSEPLGVPGPAIADAKLTVRANLSRNVSQLPLASTVEATADIALPMPPGRRDVFDAMFAVYKPSAAEMPPGPSASATINKYLPASYRSSFGYSRPRTPLALDDDSYHCMLKCPPPGPVAPPPPRDPAWADVFANVLRVPQIMRAAGLLHTVEVIAPDATFFAAGGWISFTLAPTSDYADAIGVPGFTRSYATRVPPLTSAERPVFTAVLFPLFADATAASAAGAGYDAVFHEAIAFDDGFAKIVHAVQPTGMDHLDEDGSGPAPVAEAGVLLGWDDEDILIGQNRQLGLNPDGTTPPDAPRGVGGYRVDVRKSGDSGWSTLSAAHRDHVMLGALDIGVFHGELRTEVHPRTIHGRMWLPAWYASWHGGSMVVDTLADKVLRNVPNATAPLYDPVGAEAVPLRYGRDYEFRVRMTDASGGGPLVGTAPLRAGESPVAAVPFRRYLPPKALRMLDREDADGVVRLTVGRPRLDYPAVVFAGVANAVDQLTAIHDANVAAYSADPDATLDDVALPDPDATMVEIRVLVRPPAFDREDTVGGWREVYTTTRDFAGDTVALEVKYADVAQIEALVHHDAGPVIVPSARDVRLELRALTRDDPGYFGNERARRSRPSTVDLHGTASAEHTLFRPVDNPLTSVFLQPGDPEPVMLARLANAFGLTVANGDTLCGPPGQRVLFGCAGLKHRLSPESGSLTLTHLTELAHVWVSAVRVEIDRDWTWKGAGSPTIGVRRGVQQLPGGDSTIDDLTTVELPHSVNGIATSGTPDRSRTVLVYLDAFAAPAISELAIKYDVSVRLENSVYATTSAQTVLPVTTPPAQTPRLVSAGHALSEYVTDDAYSGTAARSRMLWLEMEGPPADPRDAYFVRVTAHSPDPMLMARAEPAADPVGDDVSPLDPELIRVIVPGQSDDFAGLATMQKLVPATGSDRHYAVPLPPDTSSNSPELFGFWSYEIRVGHDAGDSFWSTAQGRFGPALRVEGVQHPAPGFRCAATRLAGAVLAAAPYAQPYYQGVNVLPDPPNTEIWIALYAQVHQADRAGMRNVLVDLRRAEAPERDEKADRPRARLAEVTWDDEVLVDLVGRLGLDGKAPLSVLAIEVLPEPNGGFRDPMGGDLGDVRILRTSPLAPIAADCC